MNELPLFDYAAAQQAAAQAIDQVAGATSLWWMDRAILAIRQCAVRLAAFTTDDVWQQMGEVSGPDPRAMGAAMRAAQQQGIIAPTNLYLPSSSVVCHGRPKRIWRPAIIPSLSPEVKR